MDHKTHASRFFDNYTKIQTVNKEKKNVTDVFCVIYFSYFMCNFEIPLALPDTNQIFSVTPATTVRYNHLRFYKKKICYLFFNFWRIVAKVTRSFEH